MMGHNHCGLPVKKKHHPTVICDLKRWPVQLLIRTCTAAAMGLPAERFADSTEAIAPLVVSA